MKQGEGKITRNEEIKTLRAKGLALTAIARWIKKKYGDDISRQRVHQIASGYVSPSSTKWVNVLIKSIKERDGHCCQWDKLCNGKPKKPKDLIVHHLDFDNRNNNPANLITLCTKCHGSFHSNNHVDSEIQKNLQRKGHRKRNEKLSVIFKCQQCKREFEIYKSEGARKKYCSHKCQMANTDNIALQFYMLATIERSTTLGISKEFGLSQVGVSNYIRRAIKVYDLPELNMLDRFRKRSRMSNGRYVTH